MKTGINVNRVAIGVFVLLGVCVQAVGGELVEDRSGTQHFAIRYAESDYRATEYPATTPRRDRVKITPRMLAAAKQYLVKSYRKYKAMGFKDPATNRPDQRIVLRLSRFAEHDRRGGYVRPNEGIIHMGIRRFWRSGQSRGPGHIPPRASSTTAHELFHIVQIEYDKSEDRWLLEATAQWAADQVFPDNNTHINAERRFLRSPHYPLHKVDQVVNARGHTSTDTSHGRPYGSSLFIRYLAKHHPRSSQPNQSLVRDMLERCTERSGSNAMETLVSAVAGVRANWGFEVQRTEEVGHRVVGRQGVVVTSTPVQLGAYKAGIRPGDRILGFAGTDIKDAAHLRELTAARSPGETVQVEVRRGDIVKKVSVTLSAYNRGGRTVPVLGVRMENFTIPPRPTGVRVRRHVFRPSLIAKTKTFREYYSRFAVACVTGREAPAGEALPDVAMFEGKGGKPFGLGRTISLDKPWTEHFKTTFQDPATAAMKLHQHPKWSRFGWIGGVGTRYYRIMPLEGMAPETELFADVKAEKYQVDLQGVTKVGENWKVFPATYDVGPRLHRLRVPGFGKMTHGVWLAVTHFGDLDVLPGELFPLTIRAAAPPVVRRVTVKQGAAQIYNGTWNDVLDTSGAVASRKETVRASGKLLPTSDAELEIEFSQPVERGAKPICEFDTTEIAMTSTGGGELWRGSIPKRLLAGRGEGHTITINGQAKIAKIGGYLPLDQNPTGVATAGTSFRPWKDYEHTGPGMKVVVGGEQTPKLALEGFRILRHEGERHAFGYVRNNDTVSAERLILNYTDSDPPKGVYFSGATFYPPGLRVPFHFALHSTIQAPPSAFSVAGRNSKVVSTGKGLSITNVELTPYFSRKPKTKEYRPVCFVKCTVKNTSDRPTRGRMVRVDVALLGAGGEIVGVTRVGRAGVLQPGQSVTTGRRDSLGAMATLYEGQVHGYHVVARSEQGLAGQKHSMTGKIALTVEGVRTRRELNIYNKKDYYIIVEGTVRNTGAVAVRDPVAVVNVVNRKLSHSQVHRKGLGVPTLGPGAAKPFKIQFTEYSLTSTSPNYRKDYPHVMPPMARGTYTE